MAEKLASIPAREQPEAPKDALSELIKKLGISPEVEQSIRGLKGEKKDRCILDLEDILKELEEQKLGNADKDQKIKKTLAGEYGIVILEDKISQIANTEKNTEDKNTKELNEYKLLGERLSKVKELDPTIVSQELENAKNATPLPEDVKLKIAKSSNIAPDKIDEAIQKNDNPQIKNLIDTYYLIQGGTIDGIIKKLSPEKKGEAIMAFGDLRASAREFGLSSSERADNVKALIMNQSNATQNKVIETVNSLTKDSPETMITRTGDRLTFQDPKNERYTYDIDMAKRPPQLSKSLSGLSISREIAPLSREDQEKSDKKTQAEKQLKSSQDTLSQSKNEFWQVRRDEYILQGENKSDGTESTNLYSQYIGENRGDHARYETLEQAYAQGEIAEKDKISTLEQMQNISEKMRENNATKILDGTLSPSDREKITNMLEKRISHLNSLKKSEESLSRIDKKALEYTPVGGNTEEWEKDASNSLSTISALGLHHLGQQRFEEVMEAWNQANKSSEKYQIELSKNPKIDDIQEKKFTEAINTFVGPGKNKNEVFVNLAKNLTEEQFNKSNWKDKEARAKFLFGNQESDTPTI